jgi:hypothetical protein
MPSPFRFAGIITVTFAVCGLASAQEIAPARSGVTIHKLAIDSGSVHTVKYYVTGGSPRLQALVRRVEWTENELSVVEQLQGLKLDSVVYERRLAAVRTAQLTNPYFPPDFLPHSYVTYNGWDGTTHLQKALAGQLAYEATPQAALQLIGFLEQQQTQLDAELKALPPPEKKAAQDAVDALRPRLAALPRSNVPPLSPQPVVPAERRLQKGVPAPVPAGATGAIEVQWGNSWYAAEILQVSTGSSLIHYTGWSSSWDEWVPTERIRPASIVSAAQQFPMPPDPVAFQPLVRQRVFQVR